MEAAHQFRLMQAQQLIDEYHKLIEEEKKKQSKKSTDERSHH
jgi:hypothetical protein